eukprot:m.177520 g.177520  ORF g.177520 m.177520 type:complete len:230 (+) comp25340_c0_seq1:99-788(+)
MSFLIYSVYQHAQVTDPMAMEHRSALRWHEKFWTAVWESCSPASHDLFTLTPEYGPPPYLQDASSDLATIIKQQAKRQRNRFDAIKRQQDPGFPLIDISPFTTLKPTHELAIAKQQVAEQIDQACRDTGFFYVKNHGVPKSAIVAAMDSAEEFFKQPMSIKEEVALATSDFPYSGRGYQRLAENVTQGQQDYHEGFDLLREIPSDHHCIRKGNPELVKIKVGQRSQHRK